MFRSHLQTAASVIQHQLAEYKRDELVNIYKGHGTSKEKEDVANVLGKINASQNSYWRQIKQ